MKLRATPRFKKAYKKLTQQQQDRVNASLRWFSENGRHPSLHFEKLKGSDYRTIRADRGKLRIVLHGSGSEFEIVYVGAHDYVDRAFGNKRQ